MHAIAVVPQEVYVINEYLLLYYYVHQDEKSESEDSVSDAESEEWSDTDSSSESDLNDDIQTGLSCSVHDSQPPYSRITAKFHSVFFQFFGFLLLWQAAFNVSNAAISAFMRFFKYFVLCLGRAFNSDPILHSANQLPITRLSSTTIEL